MSSAGPSGNVLELRGVHKIYNGRSAVAGVDLTVAHGEFVTLLGPSGSGKSTVINMIAGFMEPTRGDILYEGRSVTRIPAHRRHIGVVFQNYALFPHLTSAENLAFPLKMRGLPAKEIRAKVGEALSLVDLATEGGKYPRQLSGGQQQRVALARALVFDPKLLLMDEPLSSLDKRLRDKLQLDIVRVQKTLGIAVVYVTHDQDEAFLMSDRIGVINHGKLIQIGTGQDLFDAPETVFVANFIGDSNLIHGALDPVNCNLVVAGTGKRLPLDRGRVAALDFDGARGVNLMLRPARVEISKAGDAQLDGDQRCQVDGVLATTAYVAGRMLFHVESPALGAFIDCVVDSKHESARLIAGDAVTLSWNLADAVLVINDIDGAQLE
jgi:putative spermidine/putrescine transport system ATP-binding protein